LTSVLAIVALTAGKFWGWSFLDPVMGIVGALLITRWSYGLLRITGAVLLDCSHEEELIRKIRDTLGDEGEVKIDDLHVWRLGPGHYSAIVSLRSVNPESPEIYKNALCRIEELSHVTIEVNTD
jgi:Co/Zn/Cd efflux system component